MKYLRKFNETAINASEMYIEKSDIKIYREKGKVYFAFPGKYPNSWCKLPSAIEGVAMILDGDIGNRQDVRDIPLEDKDRKVQDFNIQDSIRWLWRAAKYVDTNGQDHKTDIIAGVKYYNDYKDESMLLSDGYFSRKYKDPIVTAVASANTIGELMDVMRGVKKTIAKSFRQEKDMDRFAL